MLFSSVYIFPLSLFYWQILMKMKMNSCQFKKRMKLNSKFKTRDSRGKRTWYSIGKSQRDVAIIALCLRFTVLFSIVVSGRDR